MEDKNNLTFFDHLDELRSRIIFCSLLVLITGGVSYFFIEKIMTLLTLPAKGIVLRFYFFSPHDAFLVQIKLAIFSGVTVSMPVLFYQSWMFLKPGLFQHERPRLLSLTLVSTILFIIGALFCYWVVLPIGLNFLMGFQKPFLLPMIGFDKYITFAAMLIFSFGLIFLTPIIVYLLSIFNIVNAGALAVKRGYVLVIILVLAAFLTPPDIVTQLILALPMYSLFEASVFIVRRMERKRNTKDNPEPASNP